MKAKHDDTRMMRRRPLRLGVVLGTFAFGLLFWARLIVVSDMPRMAIADEDVPDVPIDIIEPADNSVAPVPSRGANGVGQDTLTRDAASTPANEAIGDFGADPEKSTAQVTEDRD